MLTHAAKKNTAVLLTKPLSNDNSGFMHAFRAKESLPESKQYLTIPSNFVVFQSHYGNTR